MEESMLKFNNNILSCITKYLNRDDLRCMSLVCRSWSVAVKNERKSRGPFCKVIQTNISSSDGWRTEKEELVESCPFYPSLTFFFTNGRFKKNYLKQCTCLENPGYTVLIENFYPSTTIHKLMSMFFPADNSITISSMTLRYLPKKNEVFYKEGNEIFDGDFNNAEILKTSLKSFFNSDNLFKGCIILLCRENCLFLAKNLARALKNWYPKHEPILWGGAVKGLSGTNFLINPHMCETSADCITILITGTDMETSTLLLDENLYSDEMIKNKLETFRKNISLKRHSIGFLFSKRITLSFVSKLPIFQEIFKHIPLIDITGSEAFEESLKDLMKLNVNIKPKIAFMILTYNN
ncbi:uncharacterized protein LOC122515309 isoform X2 [Polistes fuscatus]|uniref:uncharacterized protein LOC122515309 isoform X2 n=1 Tax=Polistes fuscatus TaxID=30207 RepID=UPI001CAA1E5E|nr:uncharacterized protein LOC122515309 isoform X2 [Polistes fuscatus]